MKIMIASDFYCEYEIYETSAPDDLRAWIKDMINGRFSKLDETKHKVIGSQDDMDTESAVSMADEILYDSDMYED